MKMEIILNNINNIHSINEVNGEPYIRKCLKITIENGIEIIDDVENTPINLDYELAELKSLEFLYKAVEEYLKIKYNIIIF
jgi:flagellar basal body rod protein FlgC